MNGYENSNPTIQPSYRTSEKDFYINIFLKNQKMTFPKPFQAKNLPHSNLIKGDLY